MNAVGTTVSDSRSLLQWKMPDLLGNTHISEHFKLFSFLTHYVNVGSNIKIVVAQ